MRLDKGLAEGAREIAAPAAMPLFSPVMVACYPHLIGDLNILCRLLRDLHEDLTAVPATVERHGPTLHRLEMAICIVAEVSAASPTRDQLVKTLRGIAAKLNGMEDELTSSMDTISRHGFKLQHVDLASQLLAAVIVGAAWPGDVDPLTVAKLQNLRGCCAQALTGTAAPMVNFG